MSKPWNIDFNIYSILPPTELSQDLSKAEAIYGKHNMSQIVVLIGNEDPETAHKAADEFHQEFKNNSEIKKINYFIPENSTQELRAFSQRYSYSLQHKDFIENAQSNGAPFLQQKALEKIYGSFSMAKLDNLEEDPFLLSEQAFENISVKSSMLSKNLLIKDNHLITRDSANTYLMWNAELKESSSSFADENNVIGLIFQKLNELKQKYPDLVTVTSGIPFHSYESSRKAQTEIFWISSISFTLIIVLILVIYRSLFPLFTTLTTITISATTGLLTSWILFDSIHMFTLIFGTSIIGISIDYSIHFFTHWKFSQNKANGIKVRKYILKSLCLGFLTTEFAYISLMMAPFPLLRQMAIFSIAGMLSSFLSVTLIYSNFKKTQKKPNIHFILSIIGRISNAYTTKLKFSQTIRIIFFLNVVLITLFGISRLEFETDLKTLYTMSNNMKTSEMLAMKLLDMGSSGNYFIVSGKSEEDVLQRNEIFSKKMDQAINDSLIQNYLSISKFIPSETTQKRHREILLNALKDTSSHAFLQNLGYDNDSLFQKTLIQPYKYLHPTDTLPQGLQKIKSTLWIGEIDGKYYTIVLPLHLSPNANLKTFEEDGIVYVDKMNQINNSLTMLSKKAMQLVAIAYIIVYIILSIIYGFRGAFYVIRIPIFSSFSVATILGYLGIPFNFFATIGMILTLGIGIDYSLFFKESKKNISITTLAVTLSAMTTILSFGSLALSSFAPVSIFGLSIFIGILCCFLHSPFTQNIYKKN